MIDKTILFSLLYFITTILLSRLFLIIARTPKGSLTIFTLLLVLKVRGVIFNFYLLAFIGAFLNRMTNLLFFFDFSIAYRPFVSLVRQISVHTFHELIDIDFFITIFINLRHNFFELSLKLSIHFTSQDHLNLIFANFTIMISVE